MVPEVAGSIPVVHPEHRAVYGFSNDVRRGSEGREKKRYQVLTVC